MPLLPPSAFSHFGINVIDIEKMERFYVDVFGFVASDRGVRINGQRVVFLTMSAHDHHQLVLLDGRENDQGANRINQISFGFQSLDALREAFVKVSELGHDGIQQVNHGNAWSLYLKDPEGNPLELFVDSPFYTPQPCRGELDILSSTEEILRTTEALCRSRPDFATHEDWARQMAGKLAQREQGGVAHV